MLGHQATLSELISKSILASLLSCPGNSESWSFLTLTDCYEVTYFYNRHVSDF